MTFKERMQAPVELIPTWRYLLEKLSHTALLTLALWAMLPLIAELPGGRGADNVSLLNCAVIAGTGYLLIGKALWHWRHRDDPWSWQDFLFDALLGIFPVLLVRAYQGHLFDYLSLIIWLLVFIVLDDNGWGRPG